MAAADAAKEPTSILNVSYDVSRELFAKLNPVFAAEWKAKTGKTIDVKQSHGGSSKQARAVLEGLPADVVTFNQVTDIQVLHDRGNLVAADWQQKFPNNSSPYYSLPVFLVRAGNPKKIKDWGDLTGKGVQVIFPNPKTSGNARYTYLAATAYAYEKFGGDNEKSRTFMKSFLGNVPVFDTGGRAATTTFVDRAIGDVLITFEAEVQSIRREFPDRKFEVVVPSVSLQAEFPVAVVDKVVDRRGSRAVATAYLTFLYSDKAQTILAENYNRVNNPAVAQRFAKQFPPVRLVTVDKIFGGWKKATQDHFAEGGILDQVFVNR
ncbi:thiosulfate ABC transporter substrate-binding protein CysP [Alphaproteobacteria bacterium LMG 31809]|uniref:Thiosulfate ABC transporter substrate-binding protein CysP n=2 Tax=Govanella unica TaxID=2975056 RepID=A0A9X3TYY2_9PROT|nr:thiosulfate ABC transporter substrate-binding protein CysP [Govania unica]